jgi:hypothetical protein
MPVVVLTDPSLFRKSLFSRKKTGMEVVGRGALTGDN